MNKENQNIKKYCSYTRIRRGLVSEFCNFFEKKISINNNKQVLRAEEPKEFVLNKEKMFKNQKTSIQPQSKLYFMKL